MSLTAVKIQTEARAYLQDTDWTSEEQDAIRKVYPQRISEAEPKNIGGQK